MSKPPLAPESTSEAFARATRARVLAAVAARPSPSRRTELGRSLVLTVLSWLLALAVFHYAGGVRLTHRPISLILGTALGTGLVAAITAWIGLSRGRASLGRVPSVAVTVTIIAPFLIVLWKLFWSSRYDGALSEWPTRPGLKCLGLSLGIAACPLAAFVAGRRFSDPRSPVLTGVMAGAAIGAITNVLTDLWCPVAYMPHLLLGHVLPVAILSAVGAWLGTKVIRMR